MDTISGGVDNSIRLLEDFKRRKLTVNGSISVMYESRHARAPWGATAQVYKPPDRNFLFDENFKKEDNLPPLTPKVRTLVTETWSSLKSQKT